MRPFWVISSLATLGLVLVVGWLTTDTSDGLIARDYRLAVVPLFVVSVVGLFVKYLGREKVWTCVPVFCLDVLAVLSLFFAIRHWPSGDDGRGLAFVLMVGGTLSAIVVADLVATVASIGIYRKGTKVRVDADRFSNDN